MATAPYQRVIILSLVTLTACATQGVAEGRTLNGFPELSDLQRDAAQLYDSTVRHRQVTLFPTITFTCSGRVTNLTFVAAPRNSGSRDPQIQVWRTDDDRYRRVSPETRITVDQLTEISPSVFTFSPENMNFRDGDYLGFYQPREENRRMDLILQAGGGPENVYLETNNPTDSILFSEISSDLNDYPLVSVQTDPPHCAEGFLTTKSLMRYVQQLQLQDTVHYEREQRLIPDIQFICNATINKWMVAGQIGEGSNQLDAELQIWMEQPGAGQGRYNKVMSFPLVGSSLQPRSNQRNVYDFIPDEEVTISNGSVLGLFHPAFNQSSFIIYYQSNSGPQNYGEDDRDSPSENFQIQGSTKRNDYPLVTVDVTPADCATGFISADSLTEQAFFLVTFADVYGQQRMIPAMNITQDGLLTKWTFAARNFGEAIERTEYPELQILRLNSGDIYDIVHKTDSSEQPSRTGFLNVYEYLPNLPLRVRAGDILGFRQPPESSSRLSLAVIEGAGPPNEIMEPSSRKRQTNTANDLPLIFVDIAPLSPVPTTIMITGTDETSSHALSPDSTASPSPSTGPGEIKKQTTPVAAIAGGIVGVLVAIGTAVIIIVCVLRKKDKGNRRKSTIATDKHTTSREENEMINNPLYIATTSTISSTHRNAYEDIEVHYSEISMEAITMELEEDSFYNNVAVNETPLKEDNACDDMTVGEPIPTEENAAYGVAVWGDATLTVQSLELNQCSDLN